MADGKEGQVQQNQNQIEYKIRLDLYIIHDQDDYLTSDALPVDHESLPRCAQNLTLHHCRGSLVATWGGAGAPSQVGRPTTRLTGCTAAVLERLGGVFRPFKWSPKTRQNTKGCLACA